MRRLKLLVAILTEADRDLIRSFLNSGDFWLFFAMSGEAALDMLLFNTGFDLVLADVSLAGPGNRDPGVVIGDPDCRGIGISSAIRKVNAFIPLIGMTAYPIDWVLKQNGGLGVDGWLMKPFSREELEMALWKGVTRVVSA
ncbi:MAG: response regulator [Bacteroidetes bacterium]|nr:response regulator [Bacteroidota bacterium]